ncbi:MAG: hypothetical protein MUF54_16045 [Polyangiaceae bacterium]|nr:hypothetical protein [Polyangiaceae bacterium]
MHDVEFFPFRALLCPLFCAALLACTLTRDLDGLTDNHLSDPWSCLGQPAWTTKPRPETIRVISMDGASSATPEKGSYKIVPGVRFKVCYLRDPECKNPIHGPTVVPDSGTVDIPTPATDNFYFEYESDSVYAPGVTYLTLSRDRLEKPIFLASMPIDSLPDLVKLVRVTLDPQKAVLIVRVLSCDHDSSGVVGATLRTEPEWRVYYSSSGIPTPHASAMDTDGMAGLINLDEGTLSIYATRADGIPLGMISVNVRPGVFHVATVGP